MIEEPNRASLVLNCKLHINDHKSSCYAPRGPKGYAFNRTRTTYLATDLLIAHTHWSRFRGLMATDSSRFSRGQGLWINPSHGIHTFAMRFPIDAVYLDRERIVIHIEEDLKPWRWPPFASTPLPCLSFPLAPFASP